MGLPIVLPNGYILVYGWGYEGPTPAGFYPDNTIFRWSPVYQIWDGGETYVYGGDNVIWRTGTEFCKLAYQGNPYTQIQVRLVTKDVIPP